jgi:hypothetical protein
MNTEMRALALAGLFAAGCGGSASVARTAPSPASAPAATWTATGSEDAKLPGLALSIVGDADTLELAVTGSGSGADAGRFAARLDTCNEGSAASFGEIEWTVTCGGQTLVRKVDNACDPCAGLSGFLSVKRSAAAACWEAGQTTEIAVKFTLDGVHYEARSPGPDLSAAGSTSAIAQQLEKAGVTGVGVFGEACCPVHPAAAERTGNLTLAGEAPVTYPYTVYRGTPERFPAGPVCQQMGTPEVTLSYGFPSHRFDVVLLDPEGAPLTGAEKDKAAAALDRAFRAAGGQPVKSGKP